MRGASTTTSPEAVPVPSATGPITLPDCESVLDEIADEDLVSALNRGDLVKALAERGLEGARDVLRQEEQVGGEAAKRIASFRERLRRQLSRQLSRVQQDYRRKESDLESIRLRQRKLLEEEVARLQASLERSRRLSADGLAADPALLDAVRSALLVPSDMMAEAFAEPKTSIWARFVAWLKALWAKIKSLFSRSKPAPKPKKSPGRPLTLGRLAPFGRSLDPTSAGDLFSQLTPAQLEALQEAARKNLQAKSRDLSQQGKKEEAAVEAQKKALEREAEAAREQAERQREQRIKEAVEARLKGELKDRGLVRDDSGKLTVTYALVEKFARLVLDEESKALPEGIRLSLQGSASTGLYEKGKLRSSEEVARLDIPSSLLEARLRGSRHLMEEHAYVYREVRSESLHAVLMLDISGSMAEGEKLNAAKKALLALYTAVHRRYPDALVDIVAFDNNVRVLDLLALWEVPAGSFTNTGEALNVAHQLLRSSRATRKELYLITDGLPESYTDPATGQVKSGNLPRAMDMALSRASELRTVTPLVSTLVLLKSDNAAFENAAREIARVLHGSVVVTDPRRLAFELLVRFTGQSVTESAPRAADQAPEPEAKAIGPSAPTPASPGGTARDRRKARRAAAGGPAAGGG